MHPVATAMPCDFSFCNTEKQLHIGVDDKGVWFTAFNYKLYLSEQGKKWWFKDEYNELL